MASELVLYIIIPFFISLVILLIGLLSFFLREMKESIEAYECGFDPFSKMKSSFCIRFFNIAILYLLIDLEIALILPFFLKNILFFNFASSWSVMVVSMLMFLLILLLLVEVWLGGLSWKEDLN
uniref:NADH-ubiquinone oxidoreductase chain 3 n=1 Tax=Baltalimania ylvae TaxID=3341436 RepID=A0A1X9WD90_9BILA|nr:NADH dehydrogenase subunit 3 [Archaphanostoma ylvae]ARS00894.1 NADH dehydrogenase subunit 3 [Archaphanostoma ylvae]